MRFALESCCTQRDTVESSVNIAIPFKYLIEHVGPSVESRVPFTGSSVLSLIPKWLLTSASAEQHVDITAQWVVEASWRTI
jgi:hypothetical protein